MRATLTVMLVAMLVAPPAGALPVGDPAEMDSQLPNLAALPPFQIEVGQSDDQTGPALRFAVAVANRGDHPLDLLSVPDGVSTEEAAAYQCVAWATHRVCTQREEVGRFVWHPGHRHMHFADFALYELRLLDEDGQPDMGDDALVAGGQKVSFCLQDVARDRDPDHLAYERAWPLYLTCNAGPGFQGISPGWRDVYHQSLEGQQIPISGVPDGVYAVTVTANPGSILLESTADDNVAFTVIQLTGGGTGVQTAP